MFPKWVGDMADKRLRCQIKGCGLVFDCADSAREHEFEKHATAVSWAGPTWVPRRSSEDPDKWWCIHCESAFGSKNHSYYRLKEHVLHTHSARDGREASGTFAFNPLQVLN